MAEPRRAVLKDETDISGAHVVIIEARFYDDIQENTELVQALTDRQISGVILSAREADWASLPAEFQAQFDRLTVPLFPENEMKLLSRKMLGFSGLGYDEEAISALVQSVSRISPFTTAAYRSLAAWADAASIPPMTRGLSTISVKMRPGMTRSGE